MPTNSDIVSDFTQDYNRAYMLLNTYYAEAYRDVGMYLGNQWSLEQLKYLNEERRNSFTFNKIRKSIDMVSGYLSANEHASVVVPKENSNPETADQLSRLLDQVMKKSGYKAMQKARHGSLISGVSWVSPWIDYRKDYINGQISFHVDNWNDVIWDPFSYRMDLEDCTFVARRKYLSKDVIKSLVPGCEREIDSMGYGNRDEKFTYEPYARQWGLQELLAYNEYWKRRYKKGAILVDKKTGEQKPWKGTQQRLEMMKGMFPNLAVIEGYYKTVEYNVIVENRLLYSGEDPWGIGDYPFVPFYSVFEPSYDLYQWKFQSLVRLMRDSQEEYNMRKSKLLDIVDSQIGSGWKAKSGAVSNPKALFQTGQGKVVFFNPGFELGDAERIDAPNIPESLFQLSDSFDSDIKDFIDLGALGNDQTDRMSGVLYKMKQSMAVMQLGPIVENFREAQHLLSGKVLKMIQKYTPDKVERLIKEEPTPEFHNNTFLEYDIDVIEMAMTDTQKAAQFMQAWQMKMGGIDVPADMLWELSPYPIDKKFKQRLEAQAQQAEAAAQQEIEDKKQVNELLQAKAFSDISLGEERLSRIKYDAALSEERLAAAQEERARSVIDVVRAGKELQEMEMKQQGMGIEHANSILEIIRGIEEEQRLKAADTIVPQPAVNEGQPKKEKQ
jgi:hypothetical protein